MSEPKLVHGLCAVYIFRANFRLNLQRFLFYGLCTNLQQLQRRLHFAISDLVNHSTLRARATLQLIIHSTINNSIYSVRHASNKCAIPIILSRYRWSSG